MIKSKIVTVDNKKEFNCSYLYYAENSDIVVEDINQLYNLGINIDKNIIKNLELIHKSLPKFTPISWYVDFNNLTKEVSVIFYINNIHISFYNTFIKEVVDNYKYYILYIYSTEKNVWYSTVCDIDRLNDFLYSSAWTTEKTRDELYKDALELYYKNKGE